MPWRMPSGRPASWIEDGKAHGKTQSKEIGELKLNGKVEGAKKNRSTRPITRHPDGMIVTMW